MEDEALMSTETDGAAKSPPREAGVAQPALNLPASTPLFKGGQASNISTSKSPTISSGRKTKSLPESSITLTSEGKAPSPKSPATVSSARKKYGKRTYLEMVHDAIVSLKDRTGSSIPAISKWILTHNDHAKSASSNLFKNRVSATIKQGVKDGRFVKVKNSFKISAEWTKKQKAVARAKEAAKKKAENQRQKELEKAKQQKKTEAQKQIREKDLTPEERIEAARKRKQKEDAEARAKVFEQLRKRRYPIEDTKLHKEDKEWGVKPPENVAKRPTLPHTLTCLIPPHLRETVPKKYSHSVVNASCRNGALIGRENDRGLITDAIHVYHFFCGDVGNGIVVEPPGSKNEKYPKFSLKTLLYALDEVLNGNSRAGRSLPPLITHLFVTALRMLTAPEQDANLGPGELHLRNDLSKLRDGLNAVSWSQVCYFYINLMEHYFTSDVSVDRGMLPGEGMLNMCYFWNNDIIQEGGTTAGDGVLPNRYTAYLGNPQGVLAKTYSKLQNQAEPWTLKARELMALLRTLTDDILAKNHDLAEDIAARGEKLQELLKAKRAAIIKLNKMRSAHEGPKKSSKPKKSDGSECKTEDSSNGKDEAKEEEIDEHVDHNLKEETEKSLLATATKQQLVAAEKAYNKAAEAYDNSLNKLISRTEPVGLDRHFNAIYFFRPDPTMLHLEQLRKSPLPSQVEDFVPENPFRSWHVIDTKSCFDQFLESLDNRGQREAETLNTCSSLTLLKRRLLDEKKENTRTASREREKENLLRRLENARTACDAEDGRRSGRLAGIAMDELKDLEKEAKLLAKAHEEEERQEALGREKASDYSILTGYQLVMDLFAEQRATRSSKKSESPSEAVSTLLTNVPAHKLWMDDQIGGNGTLNVLTEALLGVEEKCNHFSPWTRQDIARGAWRKQLSDASCAWAIDCVTQLGPSADSSQQDDDSNENPYARVSPSKKQKIDSASSETSLANIVNLIKVCLKDLEMRVFEMSFKKKSMEETETAAANEDSSEDEDDAELNSTRNSWKIKINALRQVRTSRYGLIRDIIVAAITVARKSHLNQVAAELKAALQLLRPQAAGEAKAAAIRVLERHGGYKSSDDEDETVDFDELAAVLHVDDGNIDEAAETIFASLLCDEIRMINGSVGGDDFANKSDWNDAIRDCKSVSRLAFIIQSFLLKADEVLNLMKEGRKNLDLIIGLNAKRTSRSKVSIKNHDSSTPIWCDTELTNELVKAKVKGYPWWPARVCLPKEPIVADALKGYTLIASVGNPTLFMLNQKDVVEFTEETNEDLSKYDKSILDDLHEGMSIAKNLWRLQNCGVTPPWSKKVRPQFIEEKKSSY